MLNKSNIQALGFALALCLICSLLLSGTYKAVRPMQIKNEEVDNKKNILKALKVTDKADASSEEIAAFFATVTADKVAELYKTSVKSFVIDSAGTPIEKSVEELTDAEKATLFPIYKHVDGDKILAYAIPTSGKGLWSTCYGYFALEADLNTVKGITFYKHGETPGLGAEIAADWFQNNYVGKKILGEDGSLKSVTAIKGTVGPDTPEAQHKVDGISGSTMTANGVNSFLRADLELYNKYFQTVRSAN